MGRPDNASTGSQEILQSKVQTLHAIHFLYSQQFKTFTVLFRTYYALFFQVSPANFKRQIDIQYGSLPRQQFLANGNSGMDSNANAMNMNKKGVAFGRGIYTLVGGRYRGFSVPNLGDSWNFFSLAMQLQHSNSFCISAYLSDIMIISNNTYFKCSSTALFDESRFNP